MKVIGQQGPGVHRQGLRCSHPGQPRDEILSLGVSLKEPLPRAPPRPHLVQHTGGIESGTARQSAVRTRTRISLYRPLELQHDPSLLENGHVLIFDNGTHRQRLALPFSRVIEVDPQTKQIVWEYRDVPLYNFFSPYISGARRLPNGNTLITEGVFGRMFQVTPEKEVVWEFINPHFYPAPDGALTNAVFRATHYLAAEVPFLARQQ